MMDNFEDQNMPSRRSEISDKDQMRIEYLELSQRMLEQIYL